MPHEANTNPQAASGQREHQVLGEDLPDQAQWPGAEGDAHSELVAAGGAAREQEVAGIRARNQQHTGCGRQQNDECGAGVSEQLIF